MKMYEYKFYDNCDFKWTIPSYMTITKPLKILLDSKHCLKILTDLKDGDIFDLINNDQLNLKQTYGLIIQFMYVLYILHKNNYRHYDNNSGNICYVKTDAKQIILKQLNLKIPSYGYQFSLIDYASCLTSEYTLSERDKKSYEDNLKYNMDLFVFIQKTLLKIDNKFYKTKKLSDKILEEIFNRSNTLNVINRLINDNKELYDTIKKNILKLHPELIYEYEKIEKNLTKPKTYSRKYNLDDDICQNIAIYDKKYYCALAGIPYMDNMIGTTELLFIKNNYNNIVDIIKYFTALL